MMIAFIQTFQGKFCTTIICIITTESGDKRISYEHFYNLTQTRITLGRTTKYHVTHRRCKEEKKVRYIHEQNSLPKHGGNQAQ